MPRLIAATNLLRPKKHHAAPFLSEAGRVGMVGSLTGLHVERRARFAGLTVSQRVVLLWGGPGATRPCLVNRAATPAVHVDSRSSYAARILLYCSRSSGESSSIRRPFHCWVAWRKYSLAAFQLASSSWKAGSSLNALNLGSRRRRCRWRSSSRTDSSCIAFNMDHARRRLRGRSSLMHAKAD